MTPEELRQQRQKKLLVMTDGNLCEEMKKYDPTFQKETGFIARTIRERILKIEFPDLDPPPVTLPKSNGFRSR